MANGDTKGPYTDGRQTTLRLATDAALTVEVTRGAASASEAAEGLDVTMHHTPGAAAVTIRRD